MEPLRRLADDGLLTPDVGAWCENKYRHLQNYAQMFATATKGKWGKRVYVDLFAGAGRVRLEGTDQILHGSPLIALSVNDPFDHVVLCEADTARMTALRSRVGREYPSASVRFVRGDANTNVEEVIAQIPQHGKGSTVLSLCFADPYRLSDLKFATVRRLADLLMDFLVLVPSAMDANRNQRLYLEDDNRALDSFFGDSDWRGEWERWKLENSSDLGFDAFVTAEFGRQMSKLRYQDRGLDAAVRNRSTAKNLPLYDIVLYSRSPLGDKLWDEARKYSTPQMKLFG